MNVSDHLTEPLLPPQNKHFLNNGIDNKAEQQAKTRLGEDCLSRMSFTAMFSIADRLKKLTSPAPRPAQPPDEEYGKTIVDIRSIRPSKDSMAHQLHKNFQCMPSFNINAKAKEKEYVTVEANLPYDNGPKKAFVRFGNTQNGHWHVEMRDPVTVDKPVSATRFTLEDMCRFTYAVVSCSSSDLDATFLVNVRQPVTTRIDQDHIYECLEQSFDRSGDRPLKDATKLLGA